VRIGLWFENRGDAKSQRNRNALRHRVIAVNKLNPYFDEKWITHKIIVSLI
jgi:hypothetical protein